MKNKPFLIGICGGSGSGKTTLLKQIRQKFSETELCIISQDDYYRPREEQITDSEGVQNFDLPKSIDKKVFAQDIQKLMRFESVEKLEYTFNNEKASPKILTFCPAPIIIVEGIFIFHFKKISSLLDLKIYLNAKENLKVIRRIKRDQIERNYPIEDVLYRYQNHVLPTFEKYIEPYREQADIVINNNQDFRRGCEVLEGFMKNLLQTNT